VKNVYFKRKIASLSSAQEYVSHIQVAVVVPAGLKHASRLCTCAGGGLHL